MVSEGEEPLSSVKFHTVTRVEESMNMSFKVPTVLQQHDELASPNSVSGLLAEQQTPTVVVSVINLNIFHAKEMD